MRTLDSSATEPSCPARRLEELLTTEAPPLGELEASRPYPPRTGPKGNLIYRLITTTDHKMIGIMYVVTCFMFFFVGGLRALLMRTELAAPGLQFLDRKSTRLNSSHAIPSRMPSSA